MPGRLDELIRDLLEALTGEQPTPSDGTGDVRVPDAPVEVEDKGAPHVEVAIYQTQSLTDRNGRAPENTVSKYVAEALKRAGFAATVGFGFEPKDPPIESSYDLDAIDWWKTAPKELIAEDCNLLIFDTNGGGRGGEVYQTAPGRHIDRVLPIKDVGKGPAYRNTRANIHEVGHGLSGKHSDNMMSPPRMWYNGSTIDDFFENVNAVEESDGRRP